MTRVITMADGMTDRQARKFYAGVLSSIGSRLDRFDKEDVAGEAKQVRKEAMRPIRKGRK